MHCLATVQINSNSYFTKNLWANWMLAVHRRVEECMDWIQEAWSNATVTRHHSAEDSPKREIVWRVKKCLKENVAPLLLDSKPVLLSLLADGPQLSESSATDFIIHQQYNSCIAWEVKFSHFVSKHYVTTQFFANCFQLSLETEWGSQYKSVEAWLKGACRCNWREVIPQTLLSSTVTVSHPSVPALSFLNTTQLGLQIKTLTDHYG